MRADQTKQVQTAPAARQRSGVAAESPQAKTIAQFEAMAESSPQSDRLGQIASIIETSPRTVAQRKFAEGVNNSVLVATQRRRLDSLFGTAKGAEDGEREQGEVAQEAPPQAKDDHKPNNTGLPDNLKSGIEALSGMSMDAVRVHYDSPRPAQLNALAYAQGTDIHVSPGQERHLPHEAWHVVQQAQGRVRPTMQMAGGIPVNDEKGLEHEADVMGMRALQVRPLVVPSGTAAPSATSGSPIMATPRVPTETIQAAGLELLSSFNNSPIGEDDLPALYELLQDIQNKSSWDPDLDRIDQILTIFYKLSEGWETGLGDVLNPILKRHGEEAGIPESKISFGQVSDILWNGMGRATKMTASLLTTNPGGSRGSDATGSRWNPYVEGHLLNHLLHGPAESKNLAPFSRQLNGIHSANVEDPLKTMIYNEGRYFSYEVDVYPKSVATEEHFVPTHITCKVIERDKSEPDQPLSGGYNLEATLTNGTHASISGTSSGKPAGKHDALALSSGSSESLVQELEKQFNALVIPWTTEYGGIIMEVLEAAYEAITKYQKTRYIPKPGVASNNKKLFLPKTKVEFDPCKELGSSSMEDASFDIATGMEAFPLTLRPGNTSGAEPESDRWWSPYLKGHLLNHHLHGPADERNLTPMTNSLNQQFERDVESPLKEAVMTEGRVFKYTVTMIDSPSLDDIEPFEEKENYFPASLVYRVEEYVPKPGKSGSELEDISNWKYKNIFEKGTLYNTSESRVRPGGD